MNAPAMKREAWTCKPCDKTAFPSEGRATKAIEHIKSVNPSGHRPSRAYECPYGNGWHLTSKEYAA